MRASLERLSLIAVIALGAILVACSSGGDASTPGAADSSATATATTDASTSNGASATATPPGWVTGAIEDQQDTRYISATGGVGVSYRSACEDNARIDGSWPEGTELKIVLAGDANCADWTLMTDGDTTSWVRDRYLSETAPVVSSGGGGSAGAGTSSSSRQVEVIDFFGNLIPTAQLKVRAATYTYVDTKITAGCEASWHPVGDSVIALSGKIIKDPSPTGCGFGAVRLVPAQWVTTN